MTLASGPSPPRLLDGATGTCEVLRDFVDLHPDPSSSAAGVDPSAGMLNRCPGKLSPSSSSSSSAAPFPGSAEWSSEGGNVALYMGSLSDPPAELLSAEGFTHATVAFGMRNIPEREAAAWRLLVRAVGCVRCELELRLA